MARAAVERIMRYLLWVGAGILPQKGCGPEMPDGRAYSTTPPSQECHAPRANPYPRASYRAS